MDIPPLSSLEQYLDFLCLQGMKKAVFPGGAAAVSTGHETEQIWGMGTCGRTRLDEKGKNIDKDTIFDLASLTKPLATALSIYCLIEQGALDPDARYSYISKRKTTPDKKNITLAHLLSHSSGLSPYRPYFELFKPDSDEDIKEQILQRIIEDPLEYEIGRECRYSDLGFILLGDIIEQVSGQGLDIFFQEQIATPLGLAEEIFYLPLSINKKYPQDRFAATEFCSWRKKILQGEVHDEHCFLMGGVAGHAGLFATLNGVLRLCASVLETWQRGGNKLPISRGILDRALQRQYVNRTWSLGFDTPSTGGYTSGGRYLSQRSIGHLGYAGTSFWIDPESDSIFVLLTNRVHPSRENKKIREFRPWFHDRVMEFLVADQGIGNK